MCTSFLMFIYKSLKYIIWHITQAAWPDHDKNVMLCSYATTANINIL